MADVNDIIADIMKPRGTPPAGVQGIIDSVLSPGQVGQPPVAPQSPVGAIVADVMKPAPHELSGQAGRPTIGDIGAGVASAAKDLWSGEKSRELPREGSTLGQLWTDFTSIIKGGAAKVAAAPGQLMRDVREGPWRNLNNMSVMDRVRAASHPTMAPASAAGGVFDVVASPVKAPMRTAITRPLAERLGTTPEKVEAVTDLAIPGLGLVPYGRMASAAARGARAAGMGKGGWFERTFSPQTVDANADTAAALLREEGGEAARNSAQTAEQMRPYHVEINRLDDAARDAFVDHVEGGTAAIAALPGPLRELATRMRVAFEDRANRLAALPKYAQMQFIDDYFPHFWEDPQRAAQVARNFAGGVNRQGSGASLHARTIPTMADGRAAGLVPRFRDPIEATTRYVASMDRFIASEEVFDRGRHLGMIRYFNPRVTGASGHPESFPGRTIPQGWVPITGRGARNAAGQTAYAPEGFARVYNNFISKGLFGNAEAGTAYDVLQRASNAVTAMELGLSGFHASTMMMESMISRAARGFRDIGAGAYNRDVARVLRGARGVASAPAAPVTSAVRGRQLEQVWLGNSPGSPDMARIVNLLTAAGGRGSGISHARDYLMTAGGAPANYVRAWRQGALRGQLLADRAEWGAAAGPVAKTMATARLGFRHMGRFMQTVAAPIFETYIPKLKNGAFYDMMRSWLEANPTAAHDAQLAAARQIWDSVDNRFGELVSDNIFWNNTMKHASQLGMRSYSWNVGTVREIGGGARDLARGRWTDKASYVVGMPIVVGTMNAVYQYLKTGQSPQSVEDLVAGRTGGEAPGASVPPVQGFGRSRQDTVPERIQIPGYQKDVLGWYENWYQEALNKMSTLPRLAGQLAANQDWKSQPIINPEDSAPQWLQQYFKFAFDSLGPISIRQAVKGEKEGSAISVPEMLMGLRPAPTSVQDPEGYREQQANIHNRAWRMKERSDKKRERQYGGTE